MASRHSLYFPSKFLRCLRRCVCLNGIHVSFCTSKKEFENLQKFDEFSTFYFTRGEVLMQHLFHFFFKLQSTSSFAIKKSRYYIQIINRYFFIPANRSTLLQEIRWVTFKGIFWNAWIFLETIRKRVQKLGLMAGRKHG